MDLRRENRDLITTLRKEAPGQGATKRDDILTCNGSVCMLRTDYRRERRDQSGGSQEYFRHEMMVYLVKIARKEEMRSDQILNILF